MQLKVKGLVKMANSIREELARPITPKRCAEIKGRVDRMVGQLESGFAQYRTTHAALPTPSRRAYEYLKSLDFANMQVQLTDALSDDEIQKRQKVRLPGLQRAFDGVVTGITLRTRPESINQYHEMISEQSEMVEEVVERDKLFPEQLNPKTRQIRGWLRYFSDRSNLEAMIESILVIRPQIEHAMSRVTGRKRFPVPARVCFQPTGSMYRAAGKGTHTEVKILTPFFALEHGALKALAEAIFIKGKSVESAMAFSSTSTYQDIYAELEALGGVEERAAGATHDLNASFDRVNETYFNGEMSRPRMTWNRSFTSRKFGHFDYVNNTLMVSCSLDRECVPQFVVDFLVYHELLHKHHGVSYLSGRGHAHTPAFRRDEQKFRMYHEAEQLLTKIAIGGL